MNLRAIRIVAVATAALLLGGCASTSLFSPYPMQAAAFRQAAAGVDTSGVLLRLDQKRATPDSTLYLMERARLEQIGGDYAASKSDFEQVIGNNEAAEDKARISLSAVGATGAALVSNDNAIPYKSPAFEQVMVHQFQAFNYLGLHDFDGALVELRRAQNIQRAQELKHDDDVAKAHDDADKNKVAVDSYDSYFTGMDTIAGKVKNSFQNGYTFYASAVIEEAAGNYNDALVDYKKALELQPDNAELRDDVIRANQYFGGAPKPAAAAERKPYTPAPIPTGTVVVLFEQGFVPAKRPVGISIATLNGGFFTVQFPMYDGSDYYPPSPLAVRLPDGSSQQTLPLVDTGALAVKALREQVPGMIVRQVLRARAKYEMQKKAAEQAGPLGQFAANIYNLVSEQADLRSWLTLPGNAQATRLSLPAGTQTLEFGGATGSLSVAVEVRAGRTTIVRVVEAAGRLTTQTFAL